MIADAEWKYILDCLSGNRKYDFKEKLRPIGLSDVFICIQGESL